MARASGAPRVTPSPGARSRIVWRLGVAAARPPRPRQHARSTSRFLLCLACAAAATTWSLSGAFVGARVPPHRAARSLAPLRRHATPAADAAPEKWRPGPVEVLSGAAQKAQFLLREDPALFESTIEAELQRLNEQLEQQRNDTAVAKSLALEDDALVLRRRVQEVRDKDRSRVAMELLYLQVCGAFAKMSVPLMAPLKNGGDIKLSGRSVELTGLTDIYSDDALALVRDHLTGILGTQGITFGAISVMQIALFQAGQVYAMSALFGYYVRRVDARYKFEKLAGSLGAFGDHSEEASSQSAAGSLDDEEVQSLRDYIANFGPVEMQRMTNIASVEAQMAMETQVTALFGDLRALKEKLLGAVGLVTSSEEATERLQRAIVDQSVASIRISTDDLRRLVLEAVAFGAILYDMEKQVDTHYELTPSSSRRMGALTGDDDLDASRMLPG